MLLRCFIKIKEISLSKIIIPQIETNGMLFECEFRTHILLWTKHENSHHTIQDMFRFDSDRCCWTRILNLSSFRGSQNLFIWQFFSCESNCTDRATRKEKRQHVCTIHVQSVGVARLGVTRTKLAIWLLMLDYQGNKKLLFKLNISHG